MKTLAVQYLEDSPYVAQITPADARARLQDAFERLPIALVLIGWNVPPALLDACREETARAQWTAFLAPDGVVINNCDGACDPG